MPVKVLAKNWGDYKKGDKVEINDVAVLKAGEEENLFVKEKSK
jgi:hypothetical protein